MNFFFSYFIFSVLHFENQRCPSLETTLEWKVKMKFVTGLFNPKEVSVEGHRYKTQSIKIFLKNILFALDEKPFHTSF